MGAVAVATGAFGTAEQARASEEVSEQRSQGRGAGGRNGETTLVDGPDSYIRRGIEEILNHLQSRDIRETNDCCRRGNRRKRQNHADGDLGTRIHLQVPDHESGQDTKRPVHDTAHRAVHPRRIDNDFRVDAFPLEAGVLLPEEADRPALEDEEEEEVEGDDGVDAHGEVDDGAVRLGYRDA